MPRNKKRGVRIEVLLVLAVLVSGLSLLIYYLSSHSLAVLNPAGIIADKQRNLMLTTTLLMLMIVIPVFILTFSIAWRYRAGNKNAKYTPEWDHHRALETIWWAFPCAIIIVLALITWRSTHQLDPFKPIQSATKPVSIQVIALQWKWLFIYPDQKIATVNYVQFPESTPINFNITADAPMNSFWIPRLGGQVYAMAGMKTQLHLMADRKDEFIGVSANLSGDGFAGMKFKALSSSQSDFDAWVKSVKQNSPIMNQQTYSLVAAPSKNNVVTSYNLEDNKLYDRVVMKYMMPHINSVQQTEAYSQGVHASH
jgi:cytochrome o ubiquinol oxidase subunit II